MSGAASIQFTGLLGRDPELRFTPQGTAVASFSVCVTESRQVDGEWQDTSTSWFDVTCWKGLAEHVADSLRKGDRVAVTGRMVQRVYETKPLGGGDPEKRRAWDVIASDVAASLTFTAVAVKRKVREGQPVPAEAAGL